MLGTASYGDAHGTVTAFDAAVGLGEIVGADDTVYPFHCTAIADGSRSIEVGQPVTFTIAAGHLGRLQASEVRVG